MKLHFVQRYKRALALGTFTSTAVIEGHFFAGLRHFIEIVFGSGFLAVICTYKVGTGNTVVNNC